MEDGRGTWTSADGTATVSVYSGGAEVGDSARWSADRQKAWKLRDGEIKSAISLGLARELAARVGLPVPSLPEASYEGERNAAGEPEGEGTYRGRGGANYVGGWRAGLLAGKGVYSHADGSRYEGEYRAGKADGEGTFTYASGSSYVGQWRNDKKDGRGIFTHDDGSRYQGEWKQDKQEGRGCYTWAASWERPVQDGAWVAGEFVE